MSYVLALDCSMGGCAVGVYNAADPARSHARSEIMAMGQADLLVPMVQDVMKQAGIEFKDLALIATTHGPGSFTGLRIGLSAARSFALALDIPLKSVVTLDVLARGFVEGVHGEKRALDIAVITETKRQDYYVRYYDRDGEARSEALSLNAPEIRQRLEAGDEWALIGDAAARLAAEAQYQPSFLENGPLLPDPLIIAAMGLESFRKDPASMHSAPLYLREADVSFSKNPPRIIQPQIKP